MGFKTGKHGKVYNDDKPVTGSKSNHPCKRDGTCVHSRDDIGPNDSDDFVQLYPSGSKCRTCSTVVNDGKRSEHMKTHSISNLVDQLDPKEHETPEQTYNRIEPILDELEKNHDLPDMAQNYMSDLLNDLEEPNAEEGEYGDDAKIENYEHTLSMMRENL